MILDGNYYCISEYQQIVAIIHTGNSIGFALPKLK